MSNWSNAHHPPRTRGCYGKRRSDAISMEMRRYDVIDSYAERDSDCCESIGVCSSLDAPLRFGSSRGGGHCDAAAGETKRPLKARRSLERSFESYRKMGDVCTGLSNLSSPSAPLRRKCPAPATATPGRGSKNSNSSSSSKNNKALRSSSSFIDINRRPTRFRLYEESTDEENEENASPNSERFYDARQQDENSSPPFLSDCARHDQDRLCWSEMSKCSVIHPACGSTYGVKSGTTGLCNIGNTCFMNSAIQCLAHTPSLAEFFLSKRYKPFLSEDQKVGHCFAEVIENIYESSGRHSHLPAPYSPDVFLKGFTEDDVAPQFAGWRQHDSHEFLRVLLDQLNDDMKDKACCERYRMTRTMSDAELEEMPLLMKADYWWRRHLAQNSSFITDEFCGQLISSIQCTVCGSEAICFDPFYDISLPFPKEKHARALMLSILSTVEPAQCFLRECIHEFCKEEVLDGENMVTCSKCQEKRVCTKRLQVWRLPKVIVLHLKRFGNFQKKVKTEVKLPLKNFDVSALLHKAALDRSNIRPIYDLYATCNHTGRLNFGHYTATCIDPQSGSFYKFNDEHVSCISDVDGRNAYLLFYCRKEG